MFIQTKSFIYFCSLVLLMQHRIDNIFLLKTQKEMKRNMMIMPLVALALMASCTGKKTAHILL